MSITNIFGKPPFVFGVLTILSLYSAQVSASPILESATRRVLGADSAGSVADVKTFNGAGNFSEATVFAGMSCPVSSAQDTDLVDSGAGLHFSGSLYACYSTFTLEGGHTFANIQFNSSELSTYNFEAVLGEVFAFDPITGQTSSLLNNISIQLFSATESLFNFDSSNFGSVSASGNLLADTTYTLNLAVGGGQTAGRIDGINFSVHDIATVPEPSPFLIMLCGLCMAASRKISLRQAKPHHVRSLTKYLANF